MFNFEINCNFRFNSLQFDGFDSSKLLFVVCLFVCLFVVVFLASCVVGDRLWIVLPDESRIMHHLVYSPTTNGKKGIKG